jgi:hypothetical protein
VVGGFVLGQQGLEFGLELGLDSVDNSICHVVSQHSQAVFGRVLVEEPVTQNLQRHLILGFFALGTLGFFQRRALFTFERFVFLLVIVIASRRRFLVGHGD